MLTLIFKNIKDFLFGREVVIPDQRIGSLTARIRSKAPNQSYSWTSEHHLPGQNGKTSFILEGDSRGPFQTQLRSIYQILDELPLIREKADRELKKNADLYEPLKNWQDSFYLSSLLPLDVEKNEFELSFEPVNPTDTRYVLLEWRDGQLAEVEGK